VHLRARRHAPGPPSGRIRGNLPELTRDALGFLLHLRREYGDIVQFRLGPQTMFLLSRPRHVRAVLLDDETFVKGGRWAVMRPLLGDGLLTASGVTWQRHRRLVNPALRPGRIAGLLGTMVRLSEEAADRWAETAARGEPVDVSAEMMALSLRIAVETLFGEDIAPHIDQIGRAFHVANRHLARQIWNPLDRLVGQLPTARRRRFTAAIAELDAVVLSLIARRRGAPPRDDLLSMLIDARDEDGEGLSDRELRDEAMTMLLAGHETTANALTWAWYRLGQAPDAQRRLAAEADATPLPRAPGIRDVGRLRYSGQIFQEAMRLYPPIWMLPRLVTRDTRIAGADIPAGSTVIVSPYVTHHLPDVWENPAGFDPERFSEDATAARPQSAYLPFGGGKRTCIGQHFAMMEGRIVLSTLARRLRMELVPGLPVEPLPLLSLRPRQHVTMWARPRAAVAPATAMAPLQAATANARL